MSSGALSLHTSTRDREQTHGTRWDTALSFLFRAFALTPPVLWLTARGGTRLGFGIGTGTAPEGEKGVSEGKRKRFFPSHFFLTDFSPSRNSKTVPQRVFCGRRWVTRNETWHFQGYPVHFHFLFSLSLSSSPLLPPPPWVSFFDISCCLHFSLEWRPRPTTSRRRSFAMGSIHFDV